MAGRKVKALYDFSGEVGSAELSIVAGEILSVVREDVGDGWWEGVNQAGRTGLFPAAYVEDLDASNPPVMPPPPLPDHFTDQEWGNQANTNSQNYESVEYWDDDWDDDSENGGPPLPPQPHSGIAPVPKPDDVTQGRSDPKGSVGIRNIHRFSTFAKSSGESYILGHIKITVPDADKTHILENGDNIVWSPITQSYLCLVASPKKESKLKGLKSFIAYQLTPTFNNIQVSRRYKHFDWLHERLEEKFCLIPIPPLPDKQISGRYEGQFIEHRKNQLQAFVDYVCRHPVLSRCSVWEHFITCTDEKRWKQGKRKAEKDDLLGAHYFLAIQAPEKPINQYQLEQDTDTCSRFVHSMDVAVKNLMACSEIQVKKYQGPYKSEYQKVGQAFFNFGQVFGTEESKGVSSPALTNAIKGIGDTYNDIGKMFEEQPKLDWEPLGDVLHIFKGVLAAFPDILTVHKGALQKRKECEKLKSDHKMETYQMEEVVRRTDVMSYALLAEINHFHNERTTEIKTSMKRFLEEQVTFYQNIVMKLQVALANFQD